MLQSTRVTAKRKLFGVSAEIQREIAAAEVDRELPPESAQYVPAAAREARAPVTQGATTEDEAALGLDNSAAQEEHELRSLAVPEADQKKA